MARTQVRACVNQATEIVSMLITRATFHACLAHQGLLMKEILAHVFSAPLGSLCRFISREHQVKATVRHVLPEPTNF